MNPVSPASDLQLIIDSAPALIHTSLPDGHLDFFNQTWLTYVGRSLEDLQGWKWTTAIHPDDLEAMVEKWRAALISGEPFLHEARVRRADGEFRWMLHHKIALRDQHGNIVKWYGSSIDIEDRKQAEERACQGERELRQIVELVPHHVVVVTPEGTSLYGNQVMLDYYGLTLEDVSGPVIQRHAHPDDVDAFTAAWQRGFTEAAAWEAEARFRRRDGEYRWFLVRVTPLRDDAGRIVRWYATGTDIDERKRAEEALRESEERYRALIEVSPQIVWMSRADGYIIYLNQWWYDYSGLTREESEGIGWVQAVHPEHRDRSVDLWRQSVATGNELFNEVPARRADGQYRWHLARAVPIRDADGRIVRWMGIAIDIHDRREAEETLRRSEAWLSEAQRLSHTGSWAIDPETREVRHASPELLRILGFDADEGIPPTEAMLARLHPEARAKLASLTDRSVRGYALDRRLVLPDGTIRHLHTVSHPVFDAAGQLIELIGTVMDVTERKHAEEALRRSEAWLSEAQRLTHTGSWVMDPETREVRHASPELLRIFGFDPGEGIPPTEAMVARLHPEDRAKVAEEVDAAIRERRGYALDPRLVLPDGTIRHLHTVSHPVFDAAGHAIELIGTVMDVTERVRAGEALRESAERYRNIFETVGVAIIEEDFSKVMERLSDLKARGVRDFRRHLAEHPEIARETLALVQVTDANSAALGLFGAASKEEFFAGLPRMVTREMIVAWNAQLIAVAEGRHSVEEVLLNTLRGEKVHTLVTIVLPPQSSSYNSVLVTVVDVTERKQAEEAVREAQATLAHLARVTTIGELASSIAHEVNQPLAAVVTNGNASLRWLAAEPPNIDEAQECARRIVRDGKRAGDVIARIRTLAKRSPPIKAPVDLNDAIQEVLAMINAETRQHQVAVRTELSAGLPQVSADRVQLQQVLLNLTMNALDAMKGITARRRELLIRSHSESSAGVSVAVQDTGIGLDPQGMERLFQVFYTTKPSGMGLGLAISRTIIEAHGGRLWATANPTCGATFHILLPASSATGGAAAQEPHRARSSE